MGKDEKRAYVWDSERSVSAVAADTLQDLYTINGTMGSSCFSLGAANSSVMRVQVLTTNHLEVQEYSMNSNSAQQNKEATFRVEVDTWKSSGCTHSASTCFAQNRNAAIFASQEYDGARITQIYTLDQTPPHNVIVAPPPNCNLNSSVGSPILGTGKNGVPLVILYMSCDSVLQNTLVAFPIPGQIHDTSARFKPIQPAWTLAVGFLDVSFSDYTFRTADKVLLWQNHDKLTVGAISTVDGSPLWSQPISSAAAGFLSVNTKTNTALLFNYGASAASAASAASLSTVQAVDVRNGTVIWSYPIAVEPKVLQQFGMFDPSGGVAMLVWGLSGNNTLIELSSGGRELQVVHLGRSILPPNAADMLVTSNGGVIVYLGSPGRMVRLAGT
jgi:hypothetical protein